MDKFLIVASKLFVYLTIFFNLAGEVNATEITQKNTEADEFLAIDNRAVAEKFNKVQFLQSFKSKTDVVDGKSIHYLIGGKGEPLLLVHGYPESSYSWRKMLPALGQNFTVIAVDMPGFGDSTALATGDKKSVAIHLHKWLKGLGYNSISMVGHDMGGPLVYAYAAQFPNEVKKLIFSETAIPGFNFADGSPEDILKLSEHSVGGIWHFALFMNPDKAEFLVKGKERDFLKMLVHDSYVNPKAFTDDELDELTVWLKKPTGKKDGFAYYQALFTDAKDNKEFGKTKLSMPVLVVDGSAGFLQYVTSKSVKMVASDVRSVVVPQSGHFIQAERPHFFADAIRKFLLE